MSNEKVVLQKREVAWWQTVVRDALKSHSDITVAARTADRLVMELRGRLAENQQVIMLEYKPDCTCGTRNTPFHHDKCPVAKWALAQKAKFDGDCNCGAPWDAPEKHIASCPVYQRAQTKERM